MGGPISAKEALIAELLGEVDDLMKRLERFKPEIDAAQKGMTATSGELVSAIERYRSTISLLSESAQRSALNYIVEQTNAVRTKSVASQAAEFEAAALAAIDRTTGLRFERLLEQVREAASARPRERWVLWATHVATALISATVAAAAIAFARHGA